jgi:hypothetical protein
MPSVRVDHSQIAQRLSGKEVRIMRNGLPAVQPTTRQRPMTLA